MLNIYTLPLGDYQTNCYIIRAEGSQSCAVIDPGFEADVILAQLEKLGLSPDAILLTHGHFDHVGAVQQLVKATGCALWMSQSDWSQKKDPFTAYIYPLANCDFAPVQFCEEGQEISAGGVTFTVLATPGHTWGSVCYLCEDALFSGDTLFALSCGRTDLPGGNHDAILESLHRLATLPDELRVFPGHGQSTTLAAEKRYNPYMR